MIRFALSACDFLTVLVCCSDKEPVAETVRKNWIEKTFASVENLEVKGFNYSEGKLPNTSVSSEEVSKLWAEKFEELLPGYDLVITSEAYGDYVAQFMGIKHLVFDMDRQLLPVSATAVRNDLFANWQYLPASVKPDLAIKVVILGTESTGKSTLTERLALHYNCSAVTEAGRDLIDDSNSFSPEDLHLVANEHARRIDEAYSGKSPLIIIDTDIHITQSYARFTFGKTLEVSDSIRNSNKADLYLYLNNDATYVQDGTRLEETDRNALDRSHREILKENNIEYVEIDGSWEQRFIKATGYIDLLVKQKARGAWEEAPRLTEKINYNLC